MRTVIAYLLLIATIVVGNELLSREEIADFVDCLTSTSIKYNYTLLERGLLLQPYDNREMYEYGADREILACYKTRGHHCSFSFSGNLHEEDDLLGSLLLEASSVDPLFEWGWRKLKKDVPYLPSNWSALLDTPSPQGTMLPVPLGGIGAASVNNPVEERSSNDHVHSEFPPLNSFNDFNNYLVVLHKLLQLLHKSSSDYNF